MAYKYFIEDTHKQYGMWWRLDLEHYHDPLPRNEATNWTNDPNEAYDFKTKEAAQNHLDAFQNFLGMTVTEHEFVSTPQTPHTP